MNILIPMAGPDNFREQGYPFSKNLVEINGRPLIQHVYDNIVGDLTATFNFIIQKQDAQRYHLDSVLRLLDPAARIFLSEGETVGAACTALLAIDEIGSDDELVIANGDQILLGGIHSHISELREMEVDAGTVVFESIHPRWSYVRLDANDNIIEAAEKRPISRNATAGIYYFRRGQDFVDAAMSMIRKDASVNGLYFICPTLNEMILQQKRLGVVRIEREHYYSLATPQNVDAYQKLLREGSAK